MRASSSVTRSGFVMVVKREQRTGYPERGQQRAGVASVLGGDEVRRRESLPSARTQIGEIADRSGDDVQPASVLWTL